MHAYKLFRHRDKQDLVCAVPEDRAVPGFIAEKRRGGARTMAADQHEALIRAYIDEVFNGHRVDALDQVLE